MYDVLYVYRYRDAWLKKKEMAKKRMEHVESSKKLWEEEIYRRQEQLSHDYSQEMKRRERERRLLMEFRELCWTTQAKNANELRKNLDKQCVSKKTMDYIITVLITKLW